MQIGAALSDRRFYSLRPLFTEIYLFRIFQGPLSTITLACAFDSHASPERQRKQVAHASKWFTQLSSSSMIIINQLSSKSWLHPSDMILRDWNIFLQLNRSGRVMWTLAHLPTVLAESGILRALNRNIPITYIYKHNYCDGYCACVAEWMNS